MTFDNGKLTLDGYGKERGTMQSVIPADCTDTMKTKVDAKYLTDMLATLDKNESITISMTIGTDPILIQTETPDYQYVVMPLSSDNEVPEVTFADFYTPDHVDDDDVDMPDDVPMDENNVVDWGYAIDNVIPLSIVCPIDKTHLQCAHHRNNLCCLELGRNMPTPAHSIFWLKDPECIFRYIPSLFRLRKNPLVPFIV